jgi:hypothetical protein
MAELSLHASADGSRAVTIRPSGSTTAESDFSDLSSTTAWISYDVNSANRYDLNSAANSSPRVACKNKWARIEALQRNQAFIDLYRAARADHLAGREATFPAGTWWLCRFAGCKAEHTGTTAPPS